MLMPENYSKFTDLLAKVVTTTRFSLCISINIIKTKCTSFSENNLLLRDISRDVSELSVHVFSLCSDRVELAIIFVERYMPKLDIELFIDKRLC